MERIATLTEIETNWSLNDLLDANEAIDVWTAAKAHYAGVAAERLKQSMQD